MLKFKVRGSIPLIKAFATTLCEIYILPFGRVVDTLLAAGSIKAITAMQADGKIYYHATTEEAVVTYSLPTEWDQALDAFKKLLLSKEWEILSFINTAGSLWALQSDGGYGIGSNTLHEMLYIGGCVDLGHFRIQSVRRISDGEIFTIGDKIRVGELDLDSVLDVEIVDKILVNKSNNICLYTKTYHNNGLSILKAIKSISPKVLLTTADGVDITGDDQMLYILDPSTWKKGDFFFTNGPKYDGMKIFSTTKARRDYVIENKPMFSFAELTEIGVLNFLTKQLLIKEAEKKINSVTN